MTQGARERMILPMRNEFTAVIEQDEGWYVAYSPEIPGANGQGRTKDEALQSLRDAIELILTDRREDGKVISVRLYQDLSPLYPGN